MKGVLEPFRPTRKEVEAIVDEWPILTEAAKAAWHPEQDEE